MFTDDDDSPAAVDESELTQCVEDVYKVRTSRTMKTSLCPVETSVSSSIISVFQLITFSLN